MITKFIFFVNLH